MESEERRQIRADTMRKNFTKHGHSVKNPTYSSWKAMLSRCSNPNIKCYKDYGGRGITVCEEWKDYINFYKDMGDRPDGCTLDRKENSGNYCKDNCCWSTRKVQNSNKRSNVIYEINGEKYTPQQLANKVGVEVKIIFRRVHKGWSFDEILNNKRVNYKKAPKVSREEEREKYSFKIVAKAVKEGKIAKPLFCSYKNCACAKIKAYHTKGKDEENILNVEWLCSAHRPSVTLYEAFGKKQSLAEWAKELGVEKTALEHRIKLGTWKIEEVLSVGNLGVGGSREKAGI